jgi:hypothetical protein
LCQEKSGNYIPDPNAGKLNQQNDVKFWAGNEIVFVVKIAPAQGCQIDILFEINKKTFGGPRNWKFWYIL